MDDLRKKIARLKAKYQGYDSGYQIFKELFQVGGKLVSLPVNGAIARIKDITEPFNFIKDQISKISETLKNLTEVVQVSTEQYNVVRSNIEKAINSYLVELQNFKIQNTVDSTLNYTIVRKAFEMPITLDQKSYTPVLPEIKDITIDSIEMGTISDNNVPMFIFSFNNPYINPSKDVTEQAKNGNPIVASVGFTKPDLTEINQYLSENSRGKIISYNDRIVHFYQPTSPHEQLPEADIIIRLNREEPITNISVSSSKIYAIEAITLINSRESKTFHVEPDSDHGSVDIIIPAFQTEYIKLTVDFNKILPEKSAFLLTENIIVDTIDGEAYVYYTDDELIKSKEKLIEKEG